MRAKHVLPIPVEHGVSNDLANYVTLVLDLSIQDFTTFMKSQLPPGVYDHMMEQNESDLRDVLRNGNFTSTLDLFRAIATRYLAYTFVLRNVMCFSNMHIERSDGVILDSTFC